MYLNLCWIFNETLHFQTSDIWDYSYFVYRNLNISLFVWPCSLLFNSGRGLFWSVEFVKDKQTKEMYPSTCLFIDSIINECIKRGGKWLFILNLYYRFVFLCSCRLSWSEGYSWWHPWWSCTNRSAVYNYWRGTCFPCRHSEGVDWRCL
jgi:hypothetical protein